MIDPLKADAIFDEAINPKPKGISPDVGLSIFDDAIEYEESKQDQGRTIGGTLKDVGISALKGAIGVGEAGMGLADIATGGHAGRLAEKYAGYKPGEAKEILSSYYSPEQQEANKAVENATGFVDTVKAAVQNPSTIGHAVIESAPLMGAGGVIGRGAGAVSSKIAPWVAAAIGEGVVGAGSAAEGTRQQSADGTLSVKQTAMSLASGAGTGAFNLIGGKLAKKFGFDDIDTLLVSGKFSVSKEAGKKFANKAQDVAKRIMAGGISEGVLEELPQSIQEQIWSNAAIGQPLMQGVPNAAAMGLLTGSVMGSGANVLTMGGVDLGVNPDADPEDPPIPDHENAISILQDTERKIKNLEGVKNRTEKQEQSLAGLKTQSAELKQTPEYRADLERKRDNLLETAKISPEARKNLAGIEQELQALDRERANEAADRDKRFQESPFDHENTSAILDDYIKSNGQFLGDINPFEGNQRERGREIPAIPFRDNAEIPTAEEEGQINEIKRQQQNRSLRESSGKLYGDVPNEQYTDTIPFQNGEVPTPDEADQIEEINRQRQEQNLKSKIAVLKEKKKLEKKDQTELDNLYAQLKEISDPNALVKKNQARINQQLSDVEQVDRDLNQAMAGKSDFLQKLDMMQEGVNSSRAGGVNQEQPNQQGETVRFSADSPQWMQQLQKDLKADGKKLLSRKELNVLFDKVREGKPLTERQQEQFSYLERAIDNYSGETGEMVAQDTANDLEKRGFDLLGGQKMSVANLNKGDKFVGTVDGVEDEFEVTGINDMGEVTLQDGVTKQVDMFDEVSVEGIKRGEQPAIQPAAQTTDATTQEPDQTGRNQIADESEDRITVLADEIIDSVNILDFKLVNGKMNEIGKREGLSRDEAQQVFERLEGRKAERDAAQNAKLTPEQRIAGIAGPASNDILSAIENNTTVGQQEIGGDGKPTGKIIEVDITHENAIDGIDYLLLLAERGKLTPERLVANHVMRFVGIGELATLKKAMGDGTIVDVLNRIKANLELKTATKPKSPKNDTPNNTPPASDTSAPRGVAFKEDQPVTWKTKSGKEISGTLVKKNKDIWAVKKENGKITHVHEKNLVDNKPIRGEVGGMYESGQVLQTTSGRNTTPFPNVTTGTNRKAVNTLKRTEKWLIENARSESRARGDEFNSLQFDNMDLKNLSQADKDAAEQYLFGGEQPRVIKSPLKDLTAVETTGLKIQKNGSESQGSPSGKTNVPSSKTTEKKQAIKQKAKQPEKSQANQKPANPSKAENESKDYGKKNTFFTADRAAKARELLKKKLSGTQLNSGIDPEIMLAGIQLAGYHIEAGARSFAAYSKAMIQDVGDTIKPYLRSFYEGVRHYPGFDSNGMDGVDDIDASIAEPVDNEISAGYNKAKSKKENNDVSQHNTDTDIERDSGNTGTLDSVGEKGVPDGSRSAKRTDREGIQQPEKENAAGSSKSSPGHETSPFGKRGDQSPYSTDGPSRSENSTAGSDNDTRGGDVGFSGHQPDRIPAKNVVGAAQKGIDLKSKVTAQKKASKIKTIHADLSNIQNTLPILHPGQQEDVFFAEKRFSKSDGHGVMFTNGTGTGKTFSGLGIIKRFERDGKKNTLIIAPDNVIIDAWMKAAKLFDISLHKLSDTQDKGVGVTITTYANFRDNKSLVSREWDLVLADESHELSMNKAGGETGSLSMFRAITKHPRGATDRADLLYPDLLEKRNKAISDIEFARKSDDQRDWDRVPGLEKKSVKAHEAYQNAVEKVKKDVANSDKKGTRSKVVFLSATPFAYEKNIDYAEGYLFDYGSDVDDSGYNSPDAYQQFMVQHFGYRMRYNRLTEPDAEVNRGLMQRQFNSWLKKEGVLSSRTLSVDHDYDRRFVLTESAVGQKIDEGFGFLHDNHEEYGDLLGYIQDDFDYLSRRYLLEAIKAKEVIPIIKDHLANGRKVVVFHDYIKGGAHNPFDVSKLLNITTENGNPDRLSQQARMFADAKHDLVNLPIKNLPSPINALKSAFPDLLVVNGQTVTKKEMQENINRFNDDASGPCVLMVQSDKDKGWSGHDTTGDHPRVLINLGLPTRPTRAIQQEGRIYRVGQASDAMFRYLNTGTNWERWAFASTIAQRASAAENLAMGEEARALQDSFIDAFEDSDSFPPGFVGEGKGGKERDAASNAALTEWDRAMSFYFGQQKKTSRNKAREGKDYFATPEPLGLKMVEWAGVESGDKLLEPSAGHGAIARWFPENTDSTAIEPSAELSSRLKMVTPDSKVVQNNFESLHISNKYDAIVMNPPFGKGGKTAMEHVEKAFKHLRDGGRVVAIVPNGPSMDKRMEKFLYDLDKKGNAINPDAHLMAEFVLPVSTFERAGTKVSSRIVIIDKVNNSDFKLAEPITRDYSDSVNIKDFFEAIENTTSPEKAKEIVAEQSVKESETALGKIGINVSENENDKFPYKITGNTYEHKEVIKTLVGIKERKWDGDQKAWVFKNDPTDKLVETLVDDGIVEDPTQYSTTGEKVRKDESTPADFELNTSAFSDLINETETDLTPEQEAELNQDIDDMLNGKFSTTQDTDPTPGQGVALKDIQSRFKGQHVFLSPDGSISIRMQNGKGLKIESVRISDIDTQLAVKSGRMSTKGVILGKYINSTITLNKDLASNFTRDHELLHFLKDVGMLTEADLRVLNTKYTALKRKGQLRFKPNASMEENQANMFAQLLEDREQYRGTRLGRILQKVADFLDGLLHIGRMSSRKLAKSVESGKIFSREATGKGNNKVKHQTALNTDTKAFKEWFGDSKVVDENGKPLVVYHGTKDDFNAFDKKKLGLNTGHPSSKWGFAFTSDESYAKGYSYSGKEYEKIKPVYLSIKNPKTISFDEYTDILERKKSTKFKKDVERQGYDGIVVNPPVLNKSNPFYERYKLGFYEVFAFHPTQIKSIYNRGTFDPNNPDIRYQTSEDLDGDSFSLADNSTVLDDFQYNIIDQLSPISKLYKAIKKKIPEYADFRLKERLRTSKAKAKIDRAEEKYFEPIKRIIGKSGLTVENVDEFLYSRHAQEANARLRLTNARAYLMDLAKAQKGGKLKKRINEIDTKFNLEQIPNHEIQAAYLSILESEIENARTDKELAVKNKWETFSAKPSGMTDAEAKTLSKKWQDNDAMKRIARLFDRMNNESLDISFEAGRMSQEEYEAVKGTFEYYAPLYREGNETKRAFSGIGSGVKNLGTDVKIRGGSTKRAVHLLANAIVNHEKTIINAEKAEVAKAFLEFVKLNHNKEFLDFEEMKTKPFYDGHGNIKRRLSQEFDQERQAKVKVDGKVYVVSAHPGNIHAKRIVGIINGNQHNSGPIVGALSRFNRILASVNTTWNPEFIFSNLTRDLQTAALNLNDTEVSGMKKQIFKNIPKAMKGLHSLFRGDKSHEWAKVAKQYEASGAKIGWIDYGRDVETRAKKLESQIDLFRKGHATKKSISKLFSFIEDYNSIVENAVRLSTFKAGIDAGLTEAKAAITAKGLTVDFNRKGAYGPVINSLYLFANAGIQGSTRIVKTIKNNPVQMAKILGGSMAVAAALAIANSAMGGDDEDGVPHYDQIDTYLKARNMIFMLPGTKGKFVKIPLPWGYNVFWALGTEIGDAMVKKDYNPLEGVSRMLSTAMDAFNPLQSATLAQTLSPTIGDPFVQSAENKTFFGSPLMPEGNPFSRTPTPDSEKYWSSVRPLSKAGAKALNTVSGGNKVKPGLVDISPETLDLVWDYFTGGAGRFLMDTISFPGSVMTDGFNLSKTPMARKIVGTKSEYKTTTDYRENISHIYQLREQAKVYPEKTKQLRQDKTYFMYAQAKTTESILGKLRKRLKTVKSPTAKENIEKKIEKIKKGFNKKFIARRNS